MPRPALSLYRHTPIAYKQRSLLLDISRSSSQEIRAILPQIFSGFTGIITTRPQLEDLAMVQQSYMPNIIKLNSTSAAKFDCSVEEATELQASAVVIKVELGHSSSGVQLDMLRSTVAKAQSAKLATIVEIDFAQTVKDKSQVVAWAYALRLSVDFKANFLVIKMAHNVNDLMTAQQIAGGGHLLVNSPQLSTPEIKRTLATGASGIVMELSEIQAQKDPDQAAYSLGEAVFGPGSYQPQTNPSL